jgi:hypothetical protein
MESESFRGRFFRATVSEVRTVLGIFDQLGNIGNFSLNLPLVKNPQFGIICNFKKSLKNGQNNPKIGRTKPKQTSKTSHLYLPISLVVYPFLTVQINILEA